VTSHLRRDVGEGRPVRFYYDLGPGYPASLDLREPELSFEVGLGELVAIQQVVSFSREVQDIYSPGAHFWLVIDNLCGRATNDIPLERSRSYVSRLRRMIDTLGLGHRISVLVESELNSWETYRRRLEREPRQSPPEVGPKDIRNVTRFLGRPCDGHEAAARIELYRRTGRVTEALLAPAIEGVRLTQRATPSTLGFRSFPGGDQRIQVGQLAMTPRPREGLRPILITTHNAGNHDLRWLALSDGILPVLTQVLYAGPRNGRSREA
ncbi:MAG: L-tyrosine/L-tryptophan isonitrile synthase family protein, partial [Gemmatimonadota bacterium]